MKRSSVAIGLYLVGALVFGYIGFMVGWSSRLLPSIQDEQLAATHLHAPAKIAELIPVPTPYNTERVHYVPILEFTTQAGQVVQYDVRNYPNWDRLVGLYHPDDTGTIYYDQPDPHNSTVQVVSFSVTIRGDQSTANIVFDIVCKLLAVGMALLAVRSIIQRVVNIRSARLQVANGMPVTAKDDRLSSVQRGLLFGVMSIVGLVLLAGLVHELWPRDFPPMPSYPADRAKAYNFQTLKQTDQERVTSFEVSQDPKQYSPLFVETSYQSVLEKNGWDGNFNTFYYNKDNLFFYTFGKTLYESCPPFRAVAQFDTLDEATGHMKITVRQTRYSC